MADEASPLDQAAAGAPPAEAPKSAGKKKPGGKVQAEEEAKAKARAEEEEARARERENQRWCDCLEYLRTSVPQLRENPWLIILEPDFIHDYLDSLTETLANLSKHENDLDQVRVVLQDVYEGFVDIGKFAKYQPSFFISSPATVKRFVRLLEQVAHRGSDRALFPNVLCLLGPTFDRPELYDLLADAQIVNSLMSFARSDWLPTPSTLKHLLVIFKKLCASPRMRSLFMEDAGFEKFQSLADGFVEGFNKDHQQLAKEVLELFPQPQAEAEESTAESHTPGSPSVASAGGEDQPPKTPISPQS